MSFYFKAMDSRTEVEGPPAEPHHQAAHQYETNDEEGDKILASRQRAIERIEAGLQGAQ
jgi:hypothetical protein